MSDAVEKPSSCLAVVEKKPQRAGGCAGIFFQLFDWNRRFAKKKLFSKKLLPPVRLKQSSKKNEGDNENQAKIRLIADENKGGFPASKTKKGVANSDLDHKHEMRVPGLVARLMGLEAMPTLQSRKIQGEKLVDNVFGYVREDLKLEKGGTGSKHELRPPKLQKTAATDRQVVARFGSDKLPPFKNVLSKSRKHHPKLPNPARSPKNASRRCSTKLIGAASKILEPRLQPSRSKCALTYANALDHHIQNDGTGNGLQCRNCGYLPQGLDYSGQPQVFASPSGHCVGLHSACYQESEEDLHEEHPMFPQFMPYSSRLNGQIQQNSCSQQGNPQKGLTPVSSSSNRKIPSDAKESKATVGARNRMSGRRENIKFEPEKRISNRLNDSGRKRRTMNTSRESAGFVSSTIDTDKYVYHQHNRRTAESGQMGNNVASFVHNSPAKHKSGSREVSQGKVKSGFHFTDNLGQSATGEHSRRKRLEKQFCLNGDALSALLQQKLKELTCQGADIRDGNPKRTAATIFQEIISAFSSEVPSQQDDFSDITSSTKANAMVRKLSVDQQALDYVHLSPGSVLEAHLSSESCPSSSSMHGYKTVTESLDCSYCGQLTANSNPELCDPEAPTKVPNKSSKEFVLDVVNSVSKIFCCSKLADCCLGWSNLDRVEGILLNAELVLHNAVLPGSTAARAFPIRHLLVDEFDTLASVLRMNFGCSLGVEDRKEVQQLARLVFDSVIEHLHSRFEGYPYVSRKLPLEPTAKMLILETVESIGRWEELSRHCLDDLIEREMDHSLPEWTECGLEAFKTSVDISRELYQNLVDEIVQDLGDC